MTRCAPRNIITARCESVISTMVSIDYSLPMYRKRITIIDLAAQGPSTELFGRIMNANYASVMPQAVGVWAEELGHRVNYICFTGAEDLTGELVSETDVLIIGGFTYSAFTAYALSAIYRKAGAITVLGGPHARCYPEDAAKYFDYVLGFTGKPEIETILSDPAPQRPMGQLVSAVGQPHHVPGVEERWKFVSAAIAKAPFIKIIPMLGSMGCPYSCSFCIDATVPYQPLSFDLLQQDLRFIKSRVRNPLVGWHDPNFGIRFDDYLGAIEESVEPGSMRFVAESSLSLLTENNLKRLQKNGFSGLLPGIESWYDYGNKSRATKVQGEAKVKQVADQINMILRHVPFVQTNFVLGLDCDEGPEPFELTKKFLDLAPGAYPAFSLLTCYGRASPMNLDLQKSNRVLPFPFHLLDSNHAMNVIPVGYSWPEFYKLTADLTADSLSARRLARRLGANSGLTTKFINFMRSITSDRTAYMRNICEMLANDSGVRRYFDGDSDKLPDFYMDRIRGGLGHLWDSLPPSALSHDQNAFLRAQTGSSGNSSQVRVHTL